MKAYAIVCEYGAASIHESIEMICKTEMTVNELIEQLKNK
jgi:hypothetical protein